jgi:hypothetical protein
MSRIPSAQILQLPGVMHAINMQCTLYVILLSKRGFFPVFNMDGSDHFQAEREIMLPPFTRLRVLKVSYRTLGTFDGCNCVNESPAQYREMRVVKLQMMEPTW